MMTPVRKAVLLLAVSVVSACASKPPALARVSAPAPGYHELVREGKEQFERGAYLQAGEAFEQAAAMASTRERQIRALSDAGWSFILGDGREEYRDSLRRLCDLGVRPPDRAGPLGSNGSEIAELFALAAWGWGAEPGCGI